MADDRRPNGTDAERGALACSIIDSSLYMVIATADESGRPWASPVYFAVEDYRNFYWVSSLEAAALSQHRSAARGRHRRLR
jgi:Pyridoxamine 5'-phosphate oxidase